MKRVSAWFLGGRLLYVLISILVLVAVLTVALNSVVLSKVINDYLANAQADRVARDLDLANGFYHLELNDIVGIGERAAADTVMSANIAAAVRGDSQAVASIDSLLVRKLTVPQLDSSEAAIVLDMHGRIVVARTVLADKSLLRPFYTGDWDSLPIVSDSLAFSSPLSGTEAVPSGLLASIGLASQAAIAIRTTPQEAPQLFNSAEGSAGLTVLSVYPLVDASGQPAGAIVTLHLFNNDFSFVDELKNIGKIETATAFLGDLRVSTNVLDQNGVPAVGTRVSQTVYDHVLVQGQEYLGRVFVVDDWYTGRYEPLTDHSGKVIGMLYVGVRESVFRDLVLNFTKTTVLVGLVCVLVAFGIALVFSRLISQPITELAEANRRLAQGDITVRVEPFGRGEIAVLGRAFNSMAATLRANERELLHKEKLASMGQLAAGVAHELNNPLSTILLYSELLHKDCPQNDPRHEDLEMIISEAQRCKVIVADLLNFSRQQEVLSQDTDLKVLVEEVITKVDHRYQFDKVEIVRRFSPDLPHIQADPAQLQQVFINLLNNSADAMEAGGTITITVTLLDERTVEIRVADTGAGIPPEYQDKLFTPFFTTKPAGKGTGLGLSIVYGIIKMHHGQIHVESEVGQGTTVVITLPTRLPDGQQLDRSERSDLIG